MMLGFDLYFASEMAPILEPFNVIIEGLAKRSALLRGRAVGLTALVCGSLML